MKKLLSLLACLTAGAMVFTSCDSRDQDSHNPWDAGYEPEATNLVTSGDRIGRMCTMDGRITDNNDEADGIIFALNRSGDTAYLCAFTDIMLGESGRFGWTWTPNVSIAWASRVGSAKGDSVAIGTDRLMGGDMATNLILADDSVGNGRASAAQQCHEYYRIHCYTSRTDHSNDTYFQPSQGSWFLPTSQELEALIRNADLINERYLGGTTAADTVVTTVGGEDYYFLPIGGSNGYTYWTSNEFNANNAIYRVVNTNEASYYTKTLTGSTTIGKIMVRPVRKVRLQ